MQGCSGLHGDYLTIYLYSKALNCNKIKELCGISVSLHRARFLPLSCSSVVVLQYNKGGGEQYGLSEERK